MIRINARSSLILLALCLALFIGGCLSLPNSPNSQPTRFYQLSALKEPQVSKNMGMAPGIIIGIGPIKIPEYLNRPQMVTKDKDGILKFDEFNRWGESLGGGLTRMIREDLTDRVPGEKWTLYPWNPSIAVKYQVVVDVVQLESEFDKGMDFIVQWMIIDVQNSKTILIKRTEFVQPILPPNYSGLAQTLSLTCATLSSQIAKALALIKG